MPLFTRFFPLFKISSLFFLIVFPPLPEFSLFFPDFWQIFCCPGVLCPLSPTGYATVSHIFICGLDAHFNTRTKGQEMYKQPYEQQQKAEVQRSLKGLLHPNQKLTCLCSYLKIFDTFTEKWYMHLIVYYPRNSKTALKFKSRPSISWVIDQNIILTVLIHNSKPLGLLEFQCHFWVPWIIYFKIHALFSKKVLIILR